MLQPGPRCHPGLSTLRPAAHCYHADKNPPVTPEHPASLRTATPPRLPGHTPCPLPRGSSFPSPLSECPGQHPRLLRSLRGGSPQPFSPSHPSPCTTWGQTQFPTTRPRAFAHPALKPPTAPTGLPGPGLPPRGPAVPTLQASLLHSLLGLSAPRGLDAPRFKFLFPSDSEHVSPTVHRKGSAGSRFAKVPFSLDLPRRGRHSVWPQGLQTAARRTPPHHEKQPTRTSVEGCV